MLKRSHNSNDDTVKAEKKQKIEDPKETQLQDALQFVQDECDGDVRVAGGGKEKLKKYCQDKGFSDEFLTKAYKAALYQRPRWQQKKKRSVKGGEAAGASAGGRDVKGDVKGDVSDDDDAAGAGEYQCIPVALPAPLMPVPLALAVALPNHLSLVGSSEGAQFPIPTSAKMIEIQAKSEQQQKILQEKFAELENRKKAKDTAEGFVLLLRAEQEAAWLKYQSELDQFGKQEQEIKKVQAKLAELDSAILNEKEETSKEFEKEKVKIAESLYKKYNQKMEEEKVRIQAEIQAEMALNYQQQLKDLLSEKAKAVQEPSTKPPANFSSAVAFS